MEDNNNDNKAVETIKNVAKQEVNKAKNKVVLKILTYIAPVVGILLLCLLALGVIMAAVYSVINFFKGLLGIDATAEVSTLQASQSVISITDSGYELKDEYSKKILEDLEKQMIDTEEMGFSLSSENAEDMIDKYIKTEIKSMYPKIGKGQLDGLVQIQRMSAETGEIKELTYMEYEEFCNRIMQQDESVINNFSLNPDTFDLCFAVSEITQYYDYDEDDASLGKQDTSKRQVKLELKEIEYQTTLQNYATPLNYFISMHLISGDTDFMNEVVDMVNEKTDIVLTFLESTYKQIVQVDYEGAVTTISYKVEAKQNGDEIDYDYTELGRTDTAVTTGNVSNYSEFITQAQHVIEKITTVGDISVTRSNTWRVQSDLNLQKNEMRKRNNSRKSDYTRC